MTFNIQLSLILFHIILTKYHLAGNQVSGGGQPRMVWSLTNHQESRWMQAQVPITPDYPFLLTFEGKKSIKLHS